MYTWMLYFRNVLLEFHYTWHKCSLQLRNELIRFGLASVTSQSALFDHNSRIHTRVMTKFHTNSINWLNLSASGWNVVVIWSWQPRVHDAQEPFSAAVVVFNCSARVHSSVSISWQMWRHLLVLDKISLVKEKLIITNVFFIIGCLHF